MVYKYIYTGDPEKKNKTKHPQTSCFAPPRRSTLSWWVSFPQFLDYDGNLGREQESEVKVPQQTTAMQ